MLTVFLTNQLKKMANREEFKLSLDQKRRRVFSEGFKKAKVREIELGLLTPTMLMKAYSVSGTSVYRWINKFGSMKSKGEKLVVESQSDSVRLLELKKQVADLERIVGQKQLLIDFQQKMIELAEEEYQIDIKKKFSGERQPISGKTESS
jgi:transposase-like protein